MNSGVLSRNEGSFLGHSLHIAVFLSQRLSTAVKASVFVWRTELTQQISAAHTFDPVILLSCLYAFFPANTAFLFRIFSCVLIMNICDY